jgi:hypothetical protein
MEELRDVFHRSPALWQIWGKHRECVTQTIPAWELAKLMLTISLAQRVHEVPLIIKQGVVITGN